MEEQFRCLSPCYAGKAPGKHAHMMLLYGFSWSQTLPWALHTPSTQQRLTEYAATLAVLLYLIPQGEHCGLHLCFHLFCCVRKGVSNQAPNTSYLVPQPPINRYTEVSWEAQAWKDSSWECPAHQVWMPCSFKEIPGGSQCLGAPCTLQVASQSTPSRM